MVQYSVGIYLMRPHASNQGGVWRGRECAGTLSPGAYLRQDGVTGWLTAETCLMNPTVGHPRILLSSTHQDIHRMSCQGSIQDTYRDSPVYYIDVGIVSL